MASTPSLSLPLLQSSQAQKHVTVNEALLRLDGLVQLRLQSRQIADAPVPVVDGTCFAVPVGATGAWFGQDGSIAIGTNGGWVFAQPQDGWRAYIVDEGREAFRLGGVWITGVLAAGGTGATSRITIAEADEAIGAGSSVTLGLQIPKDGMVFACSARVVQDLTGTLTGWSFGTAADPTKFGSGMGSVSGAYCTGILSSPTTYYADTPLRVTAIGGTFSGGLLRVALHYYHVDLPS